MFVDKYKYGYIKVYQKWANMSTNIIIWTDIRKYKYEYNHSKKYTYILYIYIKAIKVWQLMHTCGKKIRLIGLVYNNLKM